MSKSKNCLYALIVCTFYFAVCSAAETVNCEVLAAKIAEDVRKMWDKAIEARFDCIALTRPQDNGDRQANYDADLTRRQTASQFLRSKCMAAIPDRLPLLKNHEHSLLRCIAKKSTLAPVISQTLADLQEQQLQIENIRRVKPDKE